MICHEVGVVNLRVAGVRTIRRRELRKRELRKQRLAYSAITAIFGLIFGLRPSLIYIDRSGTPAATPHKTGLVKCYMARVAE